MSTDRLSQEKKHYQLKNQFRFRVGTEIINNSQYTTKYLYNSQYIYVQRCMCVQFS